MWNVLDQNTDLQTAAILTTLKATFIRLMGLHVNWVGFMSFSTILVFYSVVLYNTSASCLDGEVRLVEVKTEWEGRLEVCLGHRWGTVSSDGWTEADVQVVCRDLGYEPLSGKL